MTVSKGYEINLVLTEEQKTVLDALGLGNAQQALYDLIDKVSQGARDPNSWERQMFCFLFGQDRLAKFNPTPNLKRTVNKATKS